MDRVVIIGLGGIGTILSNTLSRFLQYSTKMKEIVLVDGDAYEVKNNERQDFNRLGNKADIKSVELSRRFEGLNYTHVKEYIDSENIDMIIKENDVVMMCVDNHATRKLVSEYCETLKSVILISGGNEYTDGNAQMYVKLNGVEMTPTLTKYHPEISSPDDKHPNDMSCEELSLSSPQLMFTNMGAAFNMCCMFYNAIVLNDYTKSEVYFDILTMNANSKIRKP